MAYLRRIESDSKKGALIEIIADSSRLGRHPGCEIVLDNNAVSREHARLIRDQNDYHIEDLHSRNGTYVNDELITRRVKLKNGDAIRICDMRFLFFDEPGMLDSSQFNAMHLAGRATLSDESNPASDSYTIKSSIRMDNGKGLLPSGPVEMPRANAEIKLRALIDIGRNLGAQVDQVLPQLLNNLLRIFLQADCAYIILSDKQTKRLELKAFKHRDPKNRESYRISRTILEKVVFSKAAILSDDVANDSRFDPSESIINYSIYSIMAAPIMDYDQAEVLGVIQVDSRTGGKKFSYEDLDLLVSVAYQIAVTYQNAMMQDAVVAEKLLERDLAMAHRVQMSLLPLERPSIPGYGFFDHYKPAQYLGGDYYDYIPLPDGRLALALGDVSGKGVAASLFMSKLCSEVRTGLLIEPTFADTMKRLNRIYADERWENRFITFFFGILDPNRNTLTFFNAGHVPPILCDGNGSAVTLAEDKIGLPLGVAEGSEYEEHTITIEEGRTVVVISDGLTDAMNVSEKYFGMEGVLKHLRRSTTASVEDFGANLINAVNSFAGRTPQTDDQSVLIFGRRSGS
ncbi:MAG TPA: protein serine phosphatase [Planctomycetaceae bacterium]|nr:protein serine phosphatase [Planctomycetaceae bacterium]